MCVILVCEQKAPTKAVLEACAEKNPHGAGIAWRDGNVVRWEKGVDMRVKDVMSRIGQIKLPYIIHFRVSSVGLICNELCHPFPFGAQSQASSGESKHGVMFHNGTFHVWKSELRDYCRVSGRRLPDGLWSDTRAMAFLTGAYGPSWLQLIDEKIAYLTPTDIQVLGTKAQGWCRKGPDGKYALDNEPGIWFSNDLWEKKVQQSQPSTGTGANNSNAGETRPGPVVGGAYSFSRGRSAATPPTPWQKPTECDHKSSYFFTDGRRFCVPCGIRLDSEKPEPWIAPAATTTTTGRAIDHTASIAARVHRLCHINIDRVRATTPDTNITH